MRLIALTILALIVVVGAALGVARPAVTTGRATPTGTTSAQFTGTVSPSGLATRAHFEFGLDPSLRPGGGRVTYDLRTPAVSLAADAADHTVTASAKGLVPNATYHVRLVATSSAGTTVGTDRTFRTARDRKPPPPVLGTTAWVRPAGGLVLIRPPRGQSFKAAGDGASAALSKGTGFVPLTEQRQIPLGTEIDARHGSTTLATATAVGKSQLGTFGGGVFVVSQAARGIDKGLTTLSLREGGFPGAPSTAICNRTSYPALDTRAHVAVAPRVLQTLHARERGGHFRTRGRFSAGTVRGTVWDTIERCDGTLTVVHRGIVVVRDTVLGRTITLHAGQRHLARAPR